MNRPQFNARSVFVAALLASAARAQEMLRYQTGASSVIVYDDLDGDGINDYVSFALLPFPHVVVQVWSGANAALVRTIPTNLDWDSTVGEPAMVRMGDLDGDAVDEVGMLHDGSIDALSIVTGAALLTFATPGMQSPYLAVAALGDVDGDGVDDLAIGEPELHMHCHSGTNGPCVLYGGAPGRVEILSGASGAILRTITEPPPPFGLAGTLFGARVTNFSDFDGDGADDLLVSNYYGVWGPTPIFVDAYSGASGAQLFHMPFPTVEDYFARDGVLAALGDVDGDGVPDFAVGEPNRSRVRVFSGATRAQLFTSWGGPYSSSQYPSYGAGIGVVDDMNGDGVRDLVINAPQPNAPLYDFMPEPATATGFATIVSSTDGSELWTRVGHGAYEFFSVLGSLDDLDGDGKSELFAQSYDAAGTQFSWGLGLFSSRLGYSTPTNYCTSSTHLSAVGSTSVSANNLTLTIQSAPPSTTGYFVVGSRATGGGTGNLPCVLGPGLRLTPSFALDAQGNGSRAVQLANSALFLPGTTWNFQFVYAVAWPPDDVRFSDALSATFTL